MRNRIRIQRDGWELEAITAEPSDLRLLDRALTQLLETEGLAWGLYATEDDYIDAVERTYRETKWFEVCGDRATCLTIPLGPGQVLLDVTD